MFKFKKQKVKKGQPTQPEIDPQLKEQIHIMPQRFYLPPKKKRTGLVFIIVAGVLLLGSLAAVAVYLNLNLSKSQPKAPINTNQPAVVNQNQNLNANANLNLNADLDVNTNANIDTDTNINTNIETNLNLNLNVNLNTNVNTNVNISQPLPSALDADNDGLTQAEENLYGTDPENSDSDGDGYPDGAELLNGYDPTKPHVSLGASNLFISYNHPLYSIIYPASWNLQQQDEEKNEVLFQADTGEFVEVLVVVNLNNLSLTDWYQQQFPNIDLTQVQQVKVNNLTGLRQPDNQSYYLMKVGDESKIFLVIYNTGNFRQTNFATTFQVMVKSFKLLP